MAIMSFAAPDNCNLADQLKKTSKKMKKQQNDYQSQEIQQRI
jgi:hypothetical protein